MYNKIFTKILDSSIWLETDSTRIVWLTLIAAMDESGFCQFASPANLAHRARVAPEATAEAIAILEAPDTNSSDPDHDGRRIERVPGGWMVLNSSKYREIVTRAVGQEKTRERVARFRAKKHPVTHVTPCNDSVTPANVRVTPSEADTETKADIGRKRSAAASPTSDAEWLAELSKNTAYDGIAIGAEYAKMQAWCGANHKQPTRRRFVNWLNRADKPMPRQITIAAQSKAASGEPANWRTKLKQIFPDSTYDGSWGSLADSVKDAILAA